MVNSGADEAAGTVKLLTTRSSDEVFLLELFRLTVKAGFGDGSWSVKNGAASFGKLGFTLQPGQPIRIKIE